MCRRLHVVTLALILGGFVGAYTQTAPAPAKKLGELEITVSKVEQFSMTGDRFDGGPISSSLVGRIYLRFKNVGDSRVCTSLVPSVEEYKGAEWQYTQPIKTGFAYNPKIEKLTPGAETSGCYDFRPSPQKRDYVLVLQQVARTQDCGKRSESKNATTSDAPSVRFSLSESTKQQ
ncbi:MAG: hypothetical protein WCF88_16925 [Candidatus Acidiferrales bacterium]